MSAEISLFGSTDHLSVEFLYARSTAVNACAIVKKPSSQYECVQRKSSRNQCYLANYSSLIRSGRQPSKTLIIADQTYFGNMRKKVLKLRYLAYIICIGVSVKLFHFIVSKVFWILSMRNYQEKIESGIDYCDGTDIGNFIKIPLAYAFKLPTPYKNFRPKLTKKDYCVLMQIVQELVNICQGQEIQYMMYGGTLLGSWRFHGIIPWDDDVDFLVVNSQKQLLQSSLQNRSEASDSKLSIHVPTDNSQWKLFSREGTWPFVDIFFFNQNKTHIWDNHPEYRDMFVFKKKDVFPLTVRPFDSIWLPAPRNTEILLAKNYELSTCVSLETHRTMPRVVRDSHDLHITPCRELETWVPFVHRLTTSEKKTEQLWLNGSAFGSVLLLRTW